MLRAVEREDRAPGEHDVQLFLAARPLVVLADELGALAPGDEDVRAERRQPEVVLKRVPVVPLGFDFDPWDVGEPTRPGAGH